MDKELIRIIIIATGLVVILGMLLWGYIRNRRVSNDMSYLDDDMNSQKAASTLNFSAKEYADMDEDLDLLPLGSPRFDDNRHKAHFDDPSPEFEMSATQSGKGKPAYTHEYKSPHEPAAPSANSKEHLPRLLQFSIVAKIEQGFNGLDLAAVFDMVGLEYGSMKIFERLDIHRMVDFGVASMINPGTFPATEAEMAGFYTPGITFFMQPRELPDPILVYDDLVRTINLIAKELDGQKWDSERKPLTDFTLKLIRKSLQAA